MFTITGVLFSLDGGVCGGREVSILAPWERRRNRSEDEVAAALGSGSLTGSESALLARRESGKGTLSGLGLPVPDELFFLNTSRNRPTGDGERRVWDVGAVRPVSVVVRAAVGPGLPVLVLLTARVEERAEEDVSNVCAGCVSRWTAAWTMGEFVVR